MPHMIGVFGGTFDPVHNGHLRIAEAAIDQLLLDRLILVPNSRSPLKSAQPVSSFHDRVAMLKLATRGRTGIDVSLIEGERGGTSYTIDTLRELIKQYSDSRFVLIVGADALKEFHLWRDSEAIRELARIAFVERPDSLVDGNQYNAARIAMTPIDVSSSEIRDRIGRGLSIDHLVPAEVAEYIAAHGLYVAPK